MTRWQIIKLLLQVIFSRDFQAVLGRLFGRNEETQQPPSVTDPPKSRMSTYEYDPVSSRMVRR